MRREEQVRDAKCTRPSLPVEGLAPRLHVNYVLKLSEDCTKCTPSYII